MAGTNAYAAKRALIDALQASAELGDAGVQVAYSYRGERAERECVYGGAVAWTCKPLTFRGGGRMPRQETVQVDLHIAVRLPGSEPDEAEARAVELGTVVEEYLASTPTLSDLGDLKLATIAGGDLDHAVNDEESIAVITYQVAFLSTLDAD